MKRKLIAFSMSMALLFSVFSAANVGAFTATIEAPALGLLPSRAEWSFAKESDGSGIGVLQRNSTQQGAFIFNDTTEDQRLITTTAPVTREADLDFFAVTADANNIYFLTKVEKYSGIQNDPSIELMITIDTDHISGQGTTALPFVTGTYSTTQVAADAAWEYTLDVQFRKGTGGFVPAPNAFRVFTNATTSSNCTGCLAQLAASIPTGSFVEISVPWTRIPNAKPVGANYLRFAVATMYSSSGSSNRQVPADGYNSPVIDVLGNGSTLADLQDGTIDTSFDVHFNTNGTTPTYEPYAPLMVTEFQPNPIGSDSPGPTNQSTETEWIEVYNPNDFAIPLSDYKLGNTPKRGSSQGMYKFKASSIAAGAVVVVAKEKSRFLAGRPGYTGTVYDLGSDMTQYTAWASGDLQLDNQPSGVGGTFEEQVVLLDAKDGIVDMATYGNTAEPYPGHTPIAIAAVPEGTSYERCPALRDTNNSNVDFTAHPIPGEQTPGEACLGVPGLDLTVAKSGPTTPLKNETTQARYVNYTITYSNIGVAAENGVVSVVDTLPAGLSFTNTPDNASPQPNTVSPDGKVLTWNFPTGLAASASGTIVLTATVDSGVGQNVPLANNVSISGPSELEAAKTNNTAQWTTITPGPADTSVTSNLSGSIPPGSQFQFTITYRNTGQDDATDVVITDVLPAGVTILSENSPTATWDNATTGTVTWNVGTLAPNASGTIVVTAQLSSAAVIGSPLPNALSITVPLNDPTPDNNAEAKTLTVGLRKLYLGVQLR
jgi:uncharacterized repeat protein (TIGR01451 family)